MSLLAGTSSLRLAFTIGTGICSLGALRSGRTAKSRPERS
jgi:hypothetical protein